jgi:hypothetical protein
VARTAAQTLLPGCWAIEILELDVIEDHGGDVIGVLVFVDLIGLVLMYLFFKFNIIMIFLRYLYLSRRIMQD